MIIDEEKNTAKPYLKLSSLSLAVFLVISGCSSGGSSDRESSAIVDDETTTTEEATTEDAVDISYAVFIEMSADCADYSNDYEASVLDIQRSLGFDASVTISADSDSCTLSSDSIPNHDFNDDSAQFADNVSEVSRNFSIPRSPSFAASLTQISQRYYDAVMLNGVVVDMLSAGCYMPSDPQADADGNTAIGCNEDSDWLLDPLGTLHKFGADQHNAHTQPGGEYHYHGNPMAMFDDNPGPDGSPVIGFASDGFPVYGSYFYDGSTGSIRKAISGYTLKAGSRPSGATDPGGTYDGTYIDDYEFTQAGDLDECNGMIVNGQYGYYVTDDYPWIIACMSGTPDESFRK